MQVRAELHGFPEKEQTLDLPDGATADDLVRALQIHPESAVVLREGTPIPGDEPLRPGEEVHVLRIVSGGGPPAPIR